MAQLAERTGQWAAVRGSIVKAAPFSAGLRFTLDDGTGRADVVLWQDVYALISPTLQLHQGAQVAVQGEVSLYRGAIELVTELASDVTLISAAPAPSATPARPTVQAATPVSTRAPTPTRATVITPLNQIAAADKGQRVSVRGKIVAVITFSKGIRYKLDDGTGQIVLLLWQEVLDQSPPLGKLVKGAQVSVTGSVDVFNGELEVVPRSAGEVQVNP
jgi:DNA/RNA endonuclease YhcR with UshA esterase domain